MDHIIEHSPFAEKPIHLCSIDVEGHEYEVLSSMNFTSHRPDVIVVECFDITQEKAEIWTHDLSFITSHKTYQYLVERDYSLVQWMGADLVFIRNEFNGYCE